MQVPYTFPWGLHPMPNWIVKEFNRRANEYGSKPTNNINDVYSGPKTAWARFFSNGVSSLASKDLQGFVLGGTEGFNNSYGFNAEKNVVIGVDASGKPHKIDASGTSAAIVGKDRQGNDNITRGADFPHRPPPSLISVDTQFSGGSNSSFNALCRKTTISWKCSSLAQLEYLTPYFLTPRITCLVEWGWNYYDTISLVDLTDIDWLYGIFEGSYDYTGKWVEASNGNYDLAMGFITDYTITINEFGGYDCTTTITNANYLLEGQSYQNKSATSKDKDTKEVIQIKDFNEFVFNDMENMEIKQKRDGKKDIAQSYKLETKGKIFKDGDERWLRMDLIQDILNTFFSIEFLKENNAQTGVGCMKLDISGVPICANPFLKSVNKDILFPNQFAPRFVSDDKGVKNNLETATPAAGGQYFKLFPDARRIIDKYELDSTYDDLRSIINPTGNSFPMFVSYNELGAINSPPAGYWGYLKDVFVSVKFFKRLVEKNDTVLKLLEELLQHISRAMCDITQMQPRPSAINSSIYTVIDTNFTPIRTVEDATRLPRITLMSNNSAFVRSADFSIKLSGEMANQMVMQSAKGGDLPDGFGTSQVDAKTMEVSKFSRGDRMFEVGVLKPDQVVKSDKAKGSDKVKYERKFIPSTKPGVGPFYTIKLGTGDDAKFHILAETSPSFMKNVLSDSQDKRALYTNNAIMPGTKLTLELLGVGGITFLSQFVVDHVPSAYNYERCVWQVSDVKQKIENKVWTTTVIAEARPLTSLQ